MMDNCDPKEKGDLTQPVLRWSDSQSEAIEQIHKNEQNFTPNEACVVKENTFTICCERKKKENKSDNKHLKACRDGNVIEFYLANLQLSPGKKKPLIRKSKLKFLGSQYYENATKFKSDCNSEPSQFSEKSLTSVPNDLKLKSIDQNVNKSFKPLIKCESRTIKSITKDKNMFDSVNNKSFLESFSSIVLKDTSNVPNKAHSDRYNLPDFGSKHRSRPNVKRILPKRRKKLTDSELPNLNSLSLSENVETFSTRSCSEEVRNPEYEDTTINELAAYLDNFLYFPRKMSFMAEMMYT